MNENVNASSGFEELVWRGRPSQLVNIMPFIIGTVSFIFILYFSLTAWSAYDLGQYQHADKVLALIVSIPLFYVLWKMIKVWFEVKEVTTKRIKIRKSVFNSAMRPCLLFRVKDHEPDLPWYLTMFGLGSIVIETSDHSDPYIKIRAIKDAQKLHDTIAELVVKERREQGVQEIDYKT